MSVVLKSTTEFDDDTGENLYWQEGFGWVLRSEATVYDDIPEELYALQGTEFEQWQQ